MITDTAFRIYGERLRCPKCVGNKILTLEHIALKCNEFDDERIESFIYTDNVTWSPKDFRNTDIFPRFCKIAREKILNLLKISRDATFHNRQTG